MGTKEGDRPLSQFCERCKERWKNDGPHCRRCAVDLGLIKTGKLDLARTKGPEVHYRRELRPGARRFIEDGGTTFEVVYDGTVETAVVEVAP